MGSPKISESLNRFFAVTQANSGFSANDVINIKGGAAQKAGTFHKWNIFRRLGRSDAEVNANNNTREQFLDALKESFGLTEKGQALVDKLANILGKEVFKPEDYTFKGDKLDCGQPLTTRRITDVYAAVSSKVESARIANRDAIFEKFMSFAEKLSGKFESCFDGAWKALTERMGTTLEIYDTAAAIKKDTLSAFSGTDHPEVLKRFHIHPRFLGLSAALRVAIDKNFDYKDKVDARNELVNDIMNEMKKDPDFAKFHEEREKIIDEWYAASLLRRDRQEHENEIVEFLINEGLDYEGLKS